MGKKCSYLMDVEKGALPGLGVWMDQVTELHSGFC